MTLAGSRQWALGDNQRFVVPNLAVALLNHLAGNACSPDTLVALRFFSSTVNRVTESSPQAVRPR